jgi:hypothetical protein
LPWPAADAHRSHRRLTSSSTRGEVADVHRAVVQVAHAEHCRSQVRRRDGLAAEDVVDAVEGEPGRALACGLAIRDRVGKGRTRNLRGASSSRLGSSEIYFG